ncbi:hypothetical protein GCM10010911_45180 [Paenibacillus nasutitermitis]|uniref:Uncharacterized protein n=1 Tax=Paenibacillus nasutitermitis TaxID=1652958 RepID=A0A916Z8W1_9BACL|nr:hypothetical protein GCM10010911_45180 [Paenibacillus nasutitermitis]
MKEVCICDWKTRGASLELTAIDLQQAAINSVDCSLFGIPLQVHRVALHIRQEDADFAKGRNEPAH